MAAATADYQNLISALIQKQMLILGPDIALDTARNVSGLQVGDAGQADNISGKPETVLRDLVDAYSTLCRPVAQITFYNLLNQYPAVKAEYKEPLEAINLQCSL